MRSGAASRVPTAARPKPKSPAKKTESPCQTKAQDCQGLIAGVRSPHAIRAPTYRTSHWRIDSSADVDARRLQRAIRLLDRSHNKDAGARPKLGFICRGIGDNGSIGWNNDLLLSILVLEV